MHVELLQLLFITNLYNRLCKLIFYVLCISNKCFGGLVNNVPIIIMLLLLEC